MSNYLAVSETCHWCGINQKTPTVFSGLFLKNKMFFEIAICKKCFKKMFDNDYNKMAKKCLKTK